MAEMTLASVWFGEKKGYVSFTADPEKKIAVWPNTPFRDALVVGATAEATFETKVGQAKKDGSGMWPDEKFLKSWGGVEAAPKKGGGGYSRRSPEEIEAEQKNIHASVAVQQAIAFHAGKDVPAGKITETGRLFYDAMRAWVKL